MPIRCIGLVLSLLMMTLPAHAGEAELSYYIFESKGTASSGKILLENKDNPVKIPNSWFDWNCVAQKQPDGIMMDCRRGNEFAETKIYCDLPQRRFGRLMRLGKDENFVTFEARCAFKEAKVPHKKPTAHRAKPAPAPSPVDCNQCVIPPAAAVSPASPPSTTAPPAAPAPAPAAAAPSADQKSK